jgi:hypothetical protein
VQDRAPSSPLVFHASRRKWLWVLAGSLVFVSIGVMMVAGDDAVGWFPLVFFGLCAAVALATIVFQPSIEIDDEGVTLRQFWRRVRYDFRNCGPFRTWRNPVVASNVLVVFDCESASHRWLSRANARLAGASCSLPDAFGMSAEGLADLLNERRARSAVR